MKISRHTLKQPRILELTRFQTITPHFEVIEDPCRMRKSWVHSLQDKDDLYCNSLKKPFASFLV